MRLDHEQQQNYLATIMSQWTRLSPFSLLDSLEGLPSEEAKSLAALNLVRHYLDKRSLSREQVQYVKSFLSDEHSQQIMENYGPDNLDNRTNFQFTTMELHLPSEFGADPDLNNQIAEWLRRQMTNL